MTNGSGQFEGDQIRAEQTFTEQVFDQLDIEAWRKEFSQARSHYTAQLIIKLADLVKGSSVVDFGCGSGTIAHALASKGLTVLGVDRSESAIAEARRKAPASCAFVQMNWLELEPDRAFDCALFWYTTLCAGADRDIKALRLAWRHLRPGGVLLLETRHWDRLRRQFQTRSERATVNFVLIEEHAYDPLTGIQTTEQSFSFSEGAISRTYQTRRYPYLELRQMCLAAGFDRVDPFDETGAVLSNESERLILRAQRYGPPE